MGELFIVSSYEIPAPQEYNEIVGNRHDEKTNRYRNGALAAGACQIRTQPVARLLRGSPGRDGTSKWPRSPVRIWRALRERYLPLLGPISPLEKGIIALAG